MELENRPMGFWARLSSPTRHRIGPRSHRELVESLLLLWSRSPTLLDNPKIVTALGVLARRRITNAIRFSHTLKSILCNNLPERQAMDLALSLFNRRVPVDDAWIRDYGVYFQSNWVFDGTKVRDFDRIVTIPLLQLVHDVLSEFPANRVAQLARAFDVTRGGAQNQLVESLVAQWYADPWQLERPEVDTMLGKCSIAAIHAYTAKI